MKRTLHALCFCLASAYLALGQTGPKGYYGVIPVKGKPTTRVGLSATTPSLPLWDYNVTASAALGGGSYTGTIVGRNPNSHGKTTTPILTQIIPLVITIDDGTTVQTYDPTAVDPCVTPGSHTDVEVITSSPIFTKTTPWIMNNVAIGTTQYIDAFQRAEFWSLVSGTPYHLILNETTLPGQALSFSPVGGAGPGSNFAGTCGSIGVVNKGDLDTAVQALITGPLAAMVNPGTFPIFLTKSVVSAEIGHDLNTDCCVLGYHGSFFVGPSLQIYSPFSLDTSGTFSGDVSTLAHEMGEAIDDPTGSNPTPPWGGIGQVPAGKCQDNFEVGDPLSPGFGTPTAEFVVAGGNGLTYHLQELAFFSWFYGPPSLATPTKFSDNKTLKGSAKLCPPGGTN